MGTALVMGTALLRTAAPWARWLRGAALCVSLFATGCTERYELFPAATNTETPGAPGGSGLGAHQVHSCVARRAEETSTGGVWCWGNNSGFALAQSDPTLLSGPVVVPGLEAGAALSLGGEYGCALSGAGRVQCWGRNDEGQLGVGEFGDRQLPAPATLRDSVDRLSAGSGHACAVTRFGELYCWGRNAERQLGHEDTRENQATPWLVDERRDWTAVSAGDGHSCGIAAGGALYCWGRNTQGQLGLGEGSEVQYGKPTLVDDIGVWSFITAGQRIACGIQTPGSIYCWGDNGEGQLGVGDTAARWTPTRVGAKSDFRALSLKAFHVCAIDAAARLWCWGRNAEGQLGTGDTQFRPSPTVIEPAERFSEVAVGRFHTCVRRLDGAVLCTGQNADQQLGVDTPDRSATFIEVPLP